MSNGSLSFTTVEHSNSHRPDEGVYQCVATIRDVGTIVSSKATVTLAGQRRIISIFIHQHIGRTCIYKIHTLKNKHVSRIGLPLTSSFLLEYSLKLEVL